MCLLRTSVTLEACTVFSRLFGQSDDCLCVAGNVRDDTATGRKGCFCKRHSRSDMHACDRFTGAGSSLCNLVSLKIAAKIHVQYFVFIKSMQSARCDGHYAELSHPACKKLHTRAKARKSNVAKALYQRFVHVTLFGYRRLLTRQGTVLAHC